MKSTTKVKIFLLTLLFVPVMANGQSKADFNSMIPAAVPLYDKGNPSTAGNIFIYRPIKNVSPKKLQKYFATRSDIKLINVEYGYVQVKFKTGNGTYRNGNKRQIVSFTFEGNANYARSITQRAALFDIKYGKLKKYGIDETYTLLIDESSYLGTKFLAYKFIEGIMLVIKYRSLPIGEEKYCGLFKDDAAQISFNVREYFKNCDTDKWFSNGGIFLSKNSPVIPLPENFIQERNNLFKKAKSGTIFDILEYEKLYKRGDDNMTILNPRKTEMLYSSKFFDTASEKYKNDLYEQEIKAVDAFILSNKSRDKGVFATTEINALDSVLKPLYQYAQNGYDPQKYVQSVFTDFPMEHLDKLLEFEKLSAQRYSFWTDGFWGIGRNFFEKDFDVATDKTYDAISSCKQLTNSGVGKLTENYASMLKKLEQHLAYIYQQYENDVISYNASVDAERKSLAKARTSSNSSNYSSSNTNSSSEQKSSISIKKVSDFGRWQDDSGLLSLPEQAKCSIKFDDGTSGTLYRCNDRGTTKYYFGGFTWSSKLYTNMQDACNGLYVYEKYDSGTFREYYKEH
jgi:hypothetical protein